MNDAPLLLGADGAAAEAVLVFVHGRTQTPEDMAAMLAPLDLARVRVVLPRSAERTWYAAKAVEPLIEETRAALDAGCAQIDRDLAAEAPDPARRIVGGFSQGACLTAEWAMRGGQAAGYAFLTGCRVGAAGDDRPTARFDGRPVYATDGDRDPWIPLANFHDLAREIAEGGARLRTDILPGREHGAAEIEIATLAGLVAAITEGRAPW